MLATHLFVINVRDSGNLSTGCCSWPPHAGDLRIHSMCAAVFECIGVLATQSLSMNQNQLSVLSACQGRGCGPRRALTGRSDAHGDKRDGNLGSRIVEPSLTRR